MFANANVKRFTVNNLVVGEIPAGETVEVIFTIPNSGISPGDVGLACPVAALINGISMLPAVSRPNYPPGQLSIPFVNATAAPITPDPTIDYFIFMFKATGESKTFNS
jgi:hypothetical protein